MTFFVRKCLEEFNEGDKVLIKGAIVSTRKLKEIPEFSDLLAHAKVKQFAGVRQFMIDDEIEPKKIIEIMDKHPKSCFIKPFQIFF